MFLSIECGSGDLIGARKPDKKDINLKEQDDTKPSTQVVDTFITAYPQGYIDNSLIGPREALSGETDGRKTYLNAGQVGVKGSSEPLPSHLEIQKKQHENKK